MFGKLSTTLSVGALLLCLSQPAVAGLYPGLSTANHTCILQKPVLSCSAQAQPGLVDTCCTETFGGLVLSTQLWNTYTGLEASGQLLPRDTWGLHGLWPDYCNGSYTQYCDLSRQYDPLPSPNTTTGTPTGTPVVPYKGPGIGTFLEPFGKFDLLAYMSKFWVARGQPSSDFWGHEFSKHATCYSTFDVECYGPQYVEHEEVVDFFETTVNLYEQLPTYDWLADAGIVPCNGSTYALADLQSALTHRFGKVPYLGCSGPRWNATAAGAGSSDNGYTELFEVYYYHHVRGRPQDGHYERVDANITGGSLSNCAKAPRAIKYYQRTPGSDVAV